MCGRVSFLPPFSALFLPFFCPRGSRPVLVEFVTKSLSSKVSVARDPPRPQLDHGDLEERLRRFRRPHAGAALVFRQLHRSEGCDPATLRTKSRRLRPELVGDAAPLLLGALGVVLGASGGDEGGDDPPAAPAGMGKRVPHEVDAGPLRKSAFGSSMRLSGSPYGGRRPLGRHAPRMASGASEVRSGAGQREERPRPA